MVRILEQVDNNNNLECEIARRCTLIIETILYKIVLNINFEV